MEREARKRRNYEKVRKDFMTGENWKLEGREDSGKRKKKVDPPCTGSEKDKP